MSLCELRGNCRTCGPGARAAGRGASGVGLSGLEIASEFLCYSWVLKPTQMSNGRPRTTLVPLHYTRRDLQRQLPIPMFDQTTVEYVGGLLKQQHFELWRDYISKHDREGFESMRVALVHPDGLGSSHQIANRLNVDGRRLLRPPITKRKISSTRTFGTAT